MLRRALMVLTALVSSTPAAFAQSGVTGTWSCMVVSYTQLGRTDRTITMTLQPNQMYQANGTQYRTAIGINETFFSQGEWALSQDQNGPYLRMLGQARFSYDNRIEQFIFVSHIQNDLLIADQWSDQNGSTQVQCGR